jgi:murein DD-endopeptidase MepM/ murein hydrolase activator NlpD
LRFDRRQYVQLMVENSNQRQQLRALERDVEGLRHELALLAETDAQLRGSLVSHADETPSKPAGIGGALADDAADMSELQQQINALKLAIELRREAQDEIHSLLTEQYSQQSSTPKGWPTKGWLTSYFGVREGPFDGRDRMHEGLDIAANTGTTVRATADGVVVKATTDSTFGKVVMIDHGYGYRTIYAHNSRLRVKTGARVKRGEKIAEVGNTGRSTGPHLHYEVHLNGVAVNPRKFL